MSTGIKHAEWRAHNRERWNSYGQNWRDRVKAEVFEHYGTRCACCGEDKKEFLTIDHIDGGGAAHRTTFAGPIYRILKRDGFPAGYQTLCMNCNFAKGIFGRCPHINEGG